ncbi:hypothetical protein PE066_00735 [Ramlibacter tataouinensis]|uniref:tetratricopeptide repeat protein n=1 Tax=Ramlibacter tataouinensis TaxID=94132 RepID=UPI0022F3E408|nr:surface-adhesin E family protein [Ramlibacter tataouinensis]WBY02097.1 hypothetical protein PE066_00735 [Ramlibacter tataouinensis]
MHTLLLSLLLVVVALPAGAQNATRKPAASPAASPAREQPASAAKLVERARAALEAGDATKALSIAQAARRADAESYKPLYYIGVALMALGDLAGATDAQEQSLALAGSEEQKKAVADLGAAIKAQQGVVEADKALEEGLHAKAARLYEAAFDAGGRPEIGLRAASLLEEKMSDVTGAWRILRQVQARFPGSAAAATATAELTRMRPAVNKAAVLWSRVAVRSGNASDRGFLIDRAIAMNPDDPDIQIALAHHLATSGTWPQFESQLKALQRKGLLEDAMRTRRIEGGQWASHPGLRELLTDAWGAAKAGSVLAAADSDRRRFQQPSWTQTAKGATVTVFFDRRSHSRSGDIARAIVKWESSDSKPMYGEKLAVRDSSFDCKVRKMMDGLQRYYANLDGTDLILSDSRTEWKSVTEGSVAAALLDAVCEYKS